MNNGTLSLSFWLALAAGIVAFGVALVLGHHIGFLTAAIIGAVVFMIVWLVLGYALKGRAAGGGSSPTSAQTGPAPAAMTSAAPAPAAAAASTGAATAAAMPAETAAAKPAAQSAAKPAAAKAEAKPATAKAAPAKAAPAKAATAKAAAAKPAAKAPAKAETVAKPAKVAAPAASDAAKPAAAKAAKSNAAASDEPPAPGSVGKAPATLKAPRDGKADDLKIIEGIGPALEKLVNSLGFYHYDQIAGWSAEEIAWVDSHMKTFRGRIVRDKWQAQAKLIVSEGVSAFLERAKTNNY